MRNLSDDPEILKIFDIWVGPIMAKRDEMDESPMSYLAEQFHIDERELTFYVPIIPFEVKAQPCSNGCMADPTTIKVSIDDQILVLDDARVRDSIKFQIGDNVYMVSRRYWLDMKDNLNASSH